MNATVGTATVKALEEVKCYSMGKEVFEQVVRGFEKFG